MLVIGVAIVFTLQKFDGDVRESRNAANRSTATECRALIMFKQPIDPHGPCAQPEVKQYYEGLKIVTIDQTVKEILVDMGVPHG